MADEAPHCFLRVRMSFCLYLCASENQDYGFNQLPDMCFEFPLFLIGKSTMAFLTDKSWRIYRWGSRTRILAGFRGRTNFVCSAGQNVYNPPFFSKISSGSTAHGSGCHLGFICTEGAGVWVHNGGGCLGRREKAPLASS